MQPLDDAQGFRYVGGRSDGEFQFAEDRLRLMLRCTAVADDEHEGSGPLRIVRAPSAASGSTTVGLASAF